MIAGTFEKDRDTMLTRRNGTRLLPVLNVPQRLRTVRVTRPGRFHHGESATLSYCLEKDLLSIVQRIRI